MTTCNPGPGNITNGSLEARVHNNKSVQLPYGAILASYCRDGGSETTHMAVAHSYCYELLPQGRFRYLMELLGPKHSRALNVNKGAGSHRSRKCFYIFSHEWGDGFKSKGLMFC